MEDKSRYELKIDIAYGIISNKAIDRNNVPENVKAIDIIFPSLKHDKLDINFPNMTTSAKKTIIRTNLIISILSIIWYSKAVTLKNLSLLARYIARPVKTR